MREKLYNDLNSFLKNRFGEKVYKVSLDAGFSCPNLDGSLSPDGCIFCNNESIKPKYAGGDLLSQINNGMEQVRKRHGAGKFIAYLQPYSNTYADLNILKKVYEPLMSVDGVVGMAVSTRPDCVDEEKMDYLKEIQKKTYLWLELGLQSSFDGTLDRINRGHSYSDFLKAYEMASIRDIPVCVHVIFGLPGETGEMMLETVKRLSMLRIFGIKIHSMHVLKNTRLNEIYLKGGLGLMDSAAYVNLVCDAIEIMDPNIVIHRLTGEGPRELTVAPDWVFNKLGIINGIKKELIKRGSFQGSKFDKFLGSNAKQS